MVEDYIADELEIMFPEWRISTDYKVNTFERFINVQQEETEGKNRNNEVAIYVNQYQIYLGAKVINEAKQCARRIKRWLDGFALKDPKYVKVDGFAFKIHFVHVVSGPIRIGMSQDNHMEYSLNVEITVQESLTYKGE